MRGRGPKFLERRKGKPEFKTKQVHWKAEIARVEFIETRADAVFTQVTGQLVRSGIFQDRAFSEAVRFVLKLRIRRTLQLRARFVAQVMLR